MATGKYFTNKAKTRTKWWFVIDIPSGRYDRYGNQIRKQIRKRGFNTKKEAEKAEREFLDKLESGQLEKHGDILFKNVIKNFFDYMENEGKYAKGTITNYKGYYANHMQKLRMVPVKKLTPELIQSWIREMYKEHNVSEHVYNGCLKLAKRAFNYAKQMKQISVNPFIDFKPATIPQKLRKRFSIEELKRIQRICKEKYPEYYCMFSLSILSGLRLGEYSALKPSSILKQDGSYKIFVDKQITRNEYKDRMKTPKSTRIVAISNMLYNIIQWHIKTFNIKSDDFLFHTENNSMIYAKWVERHFEKLLVLCGYPKDYCRVHDLRGQYVDIMHLCGVPIVYISKQVGHSKTDVTCKAYTQILDQLPIDANQKLDKMVFGDNSNS